MPSRRELEDRRREKYLALDAAVKREKMSELETARERATFYRGKYTRTEEALQRSNLKCKALEEELAALRSGQAAADQDQGQAAADQEQGQAAESAE